MAHLLPVTLLLPSLSSGHILPTMKIVTQNFQSRAAAPSQLSSPGSSRAVARTTNWNNEVIVPLISYGSVTATVLGTAAWTYALAGATATAVVASSVAVPTIVTLSQFIFGGDGKYVAEMMGGKPADAALTSLVHDVARRADHDPPAFVFEIPTKEMNAFAAGIRKSGTVVAVTRGLRDALSERELKAVLAHEIGHLRAKDTSKNMHMVAATMGLGGLYTAGRQLLKSDQSSSKKDDKESGGTAVVGLGLMGVGLVGQGIAHLLRLGSSRRHEFAADAVASKLFGAEAIISALQKIEASAARGVRRDRLGAKGNAFAHMYISNPIPTTALTAKKGSSFRWIGKMLQLLNTHPTTHERVEALRSREP